MTQAELDDMTIKCIEAHEVVMEHGTSDMQAFSTALMRALAALIASDILGLADGHGIE